MKFKIGDIIEPKIHDDILDFKIGIITKCEMAEFHKGCEYTIIGLNNKNMITTYYFNIMATDKHCKLSASIENVSLFKKKYLEYQLCEIIEK